MKVYIKRIAEHRYIAFCQKPGTNTISAPSFSDIMNSTQSYGALIIDKNHDAETVELYAPSLKEFRLAMLEVQKKFDNNDTNRKFSALDSVLRSDRVIISWSNVENVDVHILDWTR